MKSIPIIFFASMLVGLVGCDTEVGSVQSPAHAIAEGARGSLSSSMSAVPEKVVLADNLLASNYLILLDNSGSMGDSECSGKEDKFTVAKRAIASFVKGLPASSNVALVVFKGGSAVILSPFSSGQAHKTALISALPADSGEGTPLKRSLKFAEEMMSLQAERQLWYGSYKLVVVTDGVSGDGNPGPLAKEIVLKKPFEVHAIGFCLGEGHSLDVPGYTTYYSAMDPDSLNRALASVLAEVDSFDPTTFK